MVDAHMSEFVEGMTLRYRRGKWGYRIYISRQPLTCFSDREYWTVESDDPASDFYDEPHEVDSLYDALAVAKASIAAIGGKKIW